MRRCEWMGPIGPMGLIGLTCPVPYGRSHGQPGTGQPSVSLFEHEDEHELEDDSRPSKYRPLQVQPDVRRAFDIVDRAGTNVIVLTLEVPAGNGFNLEAFYRLIVKSDAGPVVIIL